MFSRAALVLRLLAALVTVGLPSTAVPCNSTWSPWRDSCYKLISPTASWDMASRRCAAEGATLATVFSARENAFVSSLMAGKVTLAWIDLRRQTNASAYQWHSGNPLSFENWKGGVPPGTTWSPLPEDCVVINVHGQWKSSSCSNWEAYICKIAGQDDSREEYYARQAGWALAGHVFAVKTASSELECAVLCVNDVNCKSFNFKPATNQCELNAASRLHFPADLTRQRDAVYCAPGN